MKKRILLTTAILFGVFVAPMLPTTTTHAQFNPFGEVCDSRAAGEGTESVACRADNTNPISGEQGIIMRVVYILSFVVGVASVVMLMLGGLKYITANGDANAISSAKNTILYAIIGVVVFLFSQGIILFVINRL